MTTTNVKVNGKEMVINKFNKALEALKDLEDFKIKEFDFSELGLVFIYKEHALYNSLDWIYSQDEEADYCRVEVKEIKSGIVYNFEADLIKKIKEKIKEILTTIEDKKNEEVEEISEIDLDFYNAGFSKTVELAKNLDLEIIFKQYKRDLEDLLRVFDIELEDEIECFKEEREREGKEYSEEAFVKHLRRLLVKKYNKRERELEEEEEAIEAGEFFVSFGYDDYFNDEELFGSDVYQANCNDFLDIDNYEEEDLVRIVTRAKSEGFTIANYDGEDLIDLRGKYYDVKAIKNILRAKYHSPKIDGYTIEELINIFKEEEFDEIEVIEEIEEVGIDNLEELKDEIECILADKHYCLDLEDAFNLDELHRTVVDNEIEEIILDDYIELYIKPNFKHYKEEDIINFLKTKTKADDGLLIVWKNDFIDEKLYILDMLTDYK